MVDTISDNYTEQEKQYLLNLARKTLTDYFNSGKVIKIAKESVPAKLLAERGVFVTLMKKDRLRGCIGYILPNGPLFQSVIDNAINAAFEDPRFEPLRLAELSQVEIEISILTEPKELNLPNRADYLVKLRPEIDGVILQQGRSGATYLPQVWEELKNPKEFLGNLCLKAGLEPDCWLANQTQVLIYQAIVFKEA
jgi:AmmeMemoRadiSam system protein A